MSSLIKQIQDRESLAAKAAAYDEMVAQNTEKSRMREAYDKGRVDSEASLARMLYDQVLSSEAPQTPEEALLMQRQDEIGQINLPQTPSLANYKDISYDQAKLAGMVQ